MTQPACTILANGARLNSTPGADTHLVLGDVNIKWGRQTRIDQPGASTCTFTVLLDPAGDNETLKNLQPGSPIKITAVNTIQPPATTRTIWQNHERIKITPTGFNPVNQWWRPQNKSTDPTAWDNVPKAEYGNTITASLHVAMPPGTNAHIVPIYFKTPASEPIEDTNTYPLNNGNNTIRFQTNPLYAGYWVSIRIKAESVGPSYTSTYPKTWREYPISFESLGTLYLSNITLTVTESVSAEISVFSGNVVSCPLTWDYEQNRPMVKITATDFTTQLANIRIGDEPWPKETAENRFNRITRLVPNLRIHLPTSLAQTMLAGKDIDSQNVLNVIEETATSLGGLVWTAAHDELGAYIKIENPEDRATLYTLTFKNNTLTVVNRPADYLQIHASNLLLDGATWEYDITDLATNITIRYTTDDNEEHHYKIEHTQRRERFGYRSLSVSSLLTNETDAEKLAGRLIERYAPGGWTLPEATLITSNLPIKTHAQLLSASHRIGRPILITGLSQWIPGAPSTAVYLDGGEIHYNGETWTHKLFLTRGAGPTDSIRFNQLPPELTYTHALLTWDEFSTISN